RAAGPGPGLDRHAGQPGGPSARLHERGQRHPCPQAAARSGVMIRLTWRQFRTQAWVAIAALAAIAITFGLTRPTLTRMYSASGLAACQAPSDCGRLAAGFISHVRAD